MIQDVNIVTVRNSSCGKLVADPGFPRGGSANSRGAPTYDFAKFSQKLHEIERIWTPRGVRIPCAPLDPPLERLCFHKRESRILSTGEGVRGVCVSQHWGRHPPSVYPSMHCSGWYASYWNAFLFSMQTVTKNMGHLGCLIFK